MSLRAAAVCLAAVLLFGLSGCGSAAATYTQYVQAVMDCTYHGQTEEYIRLTGANEAEALALHEAQVQRTVKLICAQMTVKPEELSEDLMAGYTALAEELLGKVQYTVASAVRSGDVYQVSIVSDPLDFWEITLGDIEELYVTEFSERFAKAEDNPLRLSRLEMEWGRDVLEILSGYTEQIGYQEQISTIIRITANEDGRYTVSERTWLYIDEMLLDINS